MVKSANVKMQETAARRKEEDDKTRAELKALSVKLTAARQSAQRLPNVPSHSAHAQTISDLDDKRFGLVKAIEEGEAALNDREVECNRLKAELKDLEEMDASEEVDLDGAAIRLNLYRELGFEWVEDKGTCEHKILIQSDDVHVVALDELSSESILDRTTRLWKLNMS